MFGWRDDACLGLADLADGPPPLGGQGGGDSGDSSLLHTVQSWPKTESHPPRPRLAQRHLMWPRYASREVTCRRGRVKPFTHASWQIMSILRHCTRTHHNYHNVEHSHFIIFHIFTWVCVSTHVFCRICWIWMSAVTPLYAGLIGRDIMPDLIR